MATVGTVSSDISVIDLLASEPGLASFLFLSQLENADNDGQSDMFLNLSRLNTQPPQRGGTILPFLFDL
jgi:hypothetical protein